MNSTVSRAILVAKDTYAFRAYLEAKYIVGMNELVNVVGSSIVSRLQSPIVRINCKFTA